MTSPPPAPGRLPVNGLLGAMPYVLLGGLLLVIVRLTAVPLSNADTFLHLRYGHEFLHGWSLRDPGHVSSYGQRDWVPTQWASQMLMALMESAFGLAGVAWLTGVVVLAVVAAVFVVARQHADPLPAVVVTLLVVLASSDNLTGRPQVVSYLLILVATHVWLRTAHDLKPRWWLVPVTWAWATLHGMWPVGVVIALVTVLGIVLDNRSRLRELRPVLLRLLAVPVLSLVAAAVTPVGPRLFGAVLLVGGRAKFHDEWAATDFHMRQPLVAALLIVATLVVWLIGKDVARPPWVSLLLLLTAGVWSAYAVRTVPVAAMMTVPFAAGAFQSLVGSRRSVPRRERSIVATLVVGAVVLLTALVPLTSSRAASAPTWLDATLGPLPSGTAVQTTGPMGGYLLWRYPSIDPVIDGYTDAYTTRHLQDQLDLVQLGRGWDTVMRNTHARYALLPTRGKLAWALVRFEGWRVLHTSRGVTMLEAPPGWDS